ncbi:hypothetical protein [Flavobacterium sp. YO64]|uniref:hypothetical protein n=1 Tax=Flavobacterium sp. YO64 TaxID=394559 RepID=UPI00100BDC51|nr:hypothetical protein [Flavobacterium sp. YO64]RXM42662.1 hypothetical protein BOW57_15880 [Flavobacterium sp. YO64]
MDKKELFQSMIKISLESEPVYKFDNGDIILKLMAIQSNDCDFEFAIFHEKEWYKVTVSDMEKTKISLYEKNDNTPKAILSAFEEDVVLHRNEPIELIDLARNFVNKTVNISLKGKLKGKSIFVENTDFGKLIGIIEKENKVVSVAIEIDTEIFFCPSYNRYENSDLFLSAIQRYYDAFIRKDKNKYEGMTLKGEKIKF